jgi:hypothetical protein
VASPIYAIRSLFKSFVRLVPALVDKSCSSVKKQILDSHKRNQRAARYKPWIYKSPTVPKDTRAIVKSFDATVEIQVCQILARAVAH